MINEIKDNNKNNLFKIASNNSSNVSSPFKVVKDKNELDIIPSKKVFPLKKSKIVELSMKNISHFEKANFSSVKSSTKKIYLKKNLKKNKQTMYLKKK